jgi:hypothetical protein
MEIGLSHSDRITGITVRTVQASLPGTSSTTRVILTGLMAGVLAASFPIVIADWSKPRVATALGVLARSRWWCAWLSKSPMELAQSTSLTRLGHTEQPIRGARRQQRKAACLATGVGTARRTPSVALARLLLSRRPVAWAGTGSASGTAARGRRLLEAEVAGSVVDAATSRKRSNSARSSSCLPTIGARASIRSGLASTRIDQFASTVPFAITLAP